MASTQAAPGLQDTRQQSVGVRNPGASGISGLKFQATLVRAKFNTPLALMGRHGDTPMAERPIKGRTGRQSDQAVPGPGSEEDRCRIPGRARKMAEVLSLYARNSVDGQRHIGRSRS